MSIATAVDRVKYAYVVIKCLLSASELVIQSATVTVADIIVVIVSFYLMMKHASRSSVFELFA